MKQKKAHTWDRDENNFYVDPPSCAHALFNVEPFEHRITDPCCGMGNIVRAALDYGYEADGFDLVNRSQHWGDGPFLCGIDFLSDKFYPNGLGDVVFNPPYGRGEPGQMRLEEQCIDRALQLAQGKVAALLRLDWLAARRDFLSTSGLMRVWIVTPRPSMPPGKLVAEGKRPEKGFHDYAWYVFRKGADVAPTIGYAQRDKRHDLPLNWPWRLAEKQAAA